MMYEGSQIQERTDTITNKDGKTFCIECGRRTRYETNIGWETITVKGITFTYLRLTARCCVCGNEIYVPEVNDANVKARECAYKRSKYGSRKEIK